MIELKIALEQVDYDSLVPKLIQMIVKNPVTAKASLLAYKAKTKNMTQKEKDAFASKLLSDNKNKIMTALNSKISESGIVGYIVGFDADML